ncbi:MAG TPA: hypothetical protein VGI12_06740 [Vicinamibacterales bacterium]|jgi:hypothetical protein
MRVLTIAAVALLAGASAYAQDEAGRKVAAEVATRVPLENAIKGAPYSADTVVEGVQVLADGNRIVRKNTGHVYRDGEGRTRREEDQQAVSREVPYVPNGGPMISIVDPVAGYSYSLDPQNKIAWRTPTGTAAGIMEKMQVAEQKLKVEAEQLTATKAAPAGEMRARSGGAGGGEVRMRTPGGDIAVAYAPEPGPLEHKTLEGVAVEGRKTMTTIPAGKVGNEQPLTITSEEWRSPELKVLVLTHYSDPRSGDSSYRLTNIVRAEPDPSLFIVPSDYTVRDSGVRRMLESRK